MDKFQNKYRIPCTRLQTRDYGSNGAYFITICTAHRKQYFGKIAGTSFVETPKLGVSTGKTNRTVAANGKWKPNTIGSIVNQYKRICTINARKIHTDFNWQSRFHDHIIRNTDEYQRIQNYIANNPLKWKDDKFYGKATRTTV